MQVTDYTEKIRHLLSSFFSIQPLSVKMGERICITISPKEISFIHLNKTQEMLELLHVETLPYDQFEHLPLVLSGIVKKYKLEKTPVYCLLPPEDYQLFIIESLPVQEKEFDEALKWRVRSLINFPLENAMIDYFKLPAKKISPNHPMIAVVVSKKDRIEKLIQIFQKSHLSLTNISIPELALKNLSTLYEKDEQSSAFIYFYENLAILNITLQKTLYFTKHIILPNVTDSMDINYEEFCLDILRYFDYFQSQWRHASPNRLFIATESKDIAAIAKKLSECLQIPVEPFFFDPLLINIEINQLGKNGLLSLGYILNEEESDVKTRN